MSFDWTEQRERAAALLADDRLTDAEIATSLKISRAGLSKWKAHPEFRARVADLVAAARASVADRTIADKQARVDRLNDGWKRLQQVIEARATSEEYADAPGGKTGLLAMTYKFAPDGTPVEEFAVDTGLLKELREHEKQAAIETGQWTEKKDVSSGGKPIEFTIEIDSRVRDESA